MISDHFPIETSIAFDYIITLHKNIPFQSQKVFKSSLPPFIVDLIKERRKIRRYCQKTRCQMTKQRYNHLTLEIKISLKKFWNQNWFDFIKKMGKNPLQVGHSGKKNKLKGEAVCGPDLIHNLISFQS
ncbi:hypothetical protein BpHYR1_018853 [Brachionus plicatilis]|uniref:RNA-directed DNA polymerase from mobile element jockey-like n=1 Tax=Brachionus plicatilis TaxID=10195 RepID=A0A3M7PL35_BRAPC|nr:hypothetical protein BpHYR1_018853 [Brachionus plicatilis]